MVPVRFVAKGSGWTHVHDDVLWTEILSVLHSDILKRNILVSIQTQGQKFELERRGENH